MTTLMKASTEWSKRPEDQRFKSLGELYAQVNLWRSQSMEAAEVPLSSLRVVAEGGGVKLVGKKNIPSSLTNWAFGQLSGTLGAPAGYLRELPATLAAQNLNHGLSKVGPDDKANVLLHQNGGAWVKAFTSTKYTRIWNNDITSRLMELTQLHPEWQPAPAAFDGSRGLYASDHDMFCFFVDNDRRIFEKGPGGGLGRGFFVWNSEVGAAVFGLMTFYYEYVCGNHRVWGASGVQELKIRHVGKADDRAFGELEGELTRYADSSAEEDELIVERAHKVVLGKDKGEVLDKVFGLKIPGLTRTLITQGYELAEKREDWYGAPNTVWGLTGGLTEISRDLAFADKRVELDRAAGKLMQVAF